MYDTISGTSRVVVPTLLRSHYYSNLARSVWESRLVRLVGTLIPVTTQTKVVYLGVNGRETSVAVDTHVKKKIYPQDD